jgi:thiamine biosynthesis lipoprotein ApbE
LTADALCAALMVLGTDRGIELARNIQIDVMSLKVDDSGKVVESSAGLFIKTE